MEENELSKGSSTLNEYHQERSRIACLEVEEMLKHPSSLEEMREQTKRLMSDVSHEERGIVFEIGGERGSICISKKRHKKSFVFIIFKNETDFSDEGLSENLKSRNETFESAFDSINQLYPLHMLCLLFIHDEYKDYVSSELLKKLNEKKVSFDDFQSRIYFEEKLGVEFEFDYVSNIWQKRTKYIDQLIKEANEFEIEKETISYLKTYPYFRNYFNNIQPDRIGLDNLVVGIHFVYGWMPTIFEFKKTQEDDLVEVIPILNKAKSQVLLSPDEYQKLKELLNGSIVGTSKLLHFINPEVYAIWDSRVHNYVKKNFKSMNFGYDVGSIQNYEKYLRLLYLITEDNAFDEFYNIVNNKIYNVVKYEISKLRAIELIMFQNGKK